MVEKVEDATRREVTTTIARYHHHHRHLSHPQSLVTTTIASQIRLHRSRHHHRHARHNHDWSLLCLSLYVSHSLCVFFVLVTGSLFVKKWSLIRRSKVLCFIWFDLKLKFVSLVMCVAEIQEGWLCQNYVPTFARYCFSLSDLFSSFCNFHVFVHYMLVRDSAWLLKCALLVLISVRDHLVHWKTKFTYFYFFHPTKAYQYFFLFLVKVVVVTREQELVLCRGDVSNLSPSRLTRMLQSLTGIAKCSLWRYCDSKDWDFLLLCLCLLIHCHEGLYS